MARRQRWTDEERRELLAGFAESGLGVKAFADAAGVPHSTLAYWLRRRGESAEPPRFLAVEVEGPRACGGAEVVFGEVVVRWGGEVDEGQLVRIVRALRAC